MTIADIPIGLNTKVLHRIWYPRLVEGHVGSPESPWPYVASIGLKRSCPGPRGLQFLRTEGKVPAHGGSGGRGFGGHLGQRRAGSLGDGGPGGGRLDSNSRIRSTTRHEEAVLLPIVRSRGFGEGSGASFNCWLGLRLPIPKGTRS